MPSATTYRPYSAMMAKLSSLWERLRPTSVWPATSMRRGRDTLVGDAGRAEWPGSPKSSSISEGSVNAAARLSRPPFPGQAAEPRGQSAVGVWNAGFCGLWSWVWRRRELGCGPRLDADVPVATHTEEQELD